MTEYKILEINTKDNWIRIEVYFGEEIYTKRMMANIDSEDSIKESVDKWLADYIPLRQVEKVAPNIIGNIYQYKEK